MMEEIDRANQEMLFVSAYWAGQNADEPDIGYAMRKDYLLYQGTWSLLSVLGRALGSLSREYVL
jgi:hypothetical protein